MATWVPYQPIDGGFGEVKMLAGGSSPTVTKGVPVKHDATNGGVVVITDGDACLGIAKEATTTADAEVIIYTKGIFKCTAASGITLDKVGEEVYALADGTVTDKTGVTTGKYSCGFVVLAEGAAAGTTYVMLRPDGIYNTFTAGTAT